MSFSMDLKKTMIGFCLLIGIIPFLAIGIYSYQTASGELSDTVFDQLQAIRDVKGHGIRDRIEIWFADTDMLASDEYVPEALEAFSGYAATSMGTRSDAILVDTPAYNSMHSAYLEHFARYVDILGYYDVFIIDPQGRVLFTAARESDLGQNLATGRLKDSPLATAWRQARNSDNVFVDFVPYAPSNGIPAAFMAEPIRRNGKLLCVVALQISLERLNDFMQQRSGMGETGETYLVGQDLLMRSDSYLNPKDHSVAASFANPERGKVDTVAARQALEGETGSDIITDYNGNPVFSAYMPIHVGDTTWALIAEIDKHEALEAVSLLRNGMFTAGFAVFIAIILTTIFFIKRELLRPFAALRSFANKVARGDLDAKP
ncbi:MAG: cache domain-containing protein, partial [Oceanidesulfovibrio sp.]